MTSISGDLLDTVQIIYQAALEPEKWGDVACGVADLFRGTGSLYAHDTTSGRMLVEASQGFERASIDSYKSHFSFVNPIYPAAIEAPEMHVADIFELVPEPLLMAGEFYNDWMRPQHLHHCIGAHIDLGASTVMFLTSHRGTDSVPHSNEERRAMGILIAHIRQAVDISSKLNTWSGSALIRYGALDQLDLPAMLISRDGIVSDVNRRAQRLLQDGTFVKLVSERLVPQQESQNDLKRVLSSAIDSGRPRYIALHAKTSEALKATIIPLRRHQTWFGTSSPHALIVFRPTRRRHVSVIEQVKRGCHLTPAETKLLDALAAGETLTTYSERIQISRNTAKTQLQSLFSKTGTSRQADLIRLVAQRQS